MKVLLTLLLLCFFGTMAERSDAYTIEDLNTACQAENYSEVVKILKTNPGLVRERSNQWYETPILAAMDPHGVLVAYRRDAGPYDPRIIPYLVKHGCPVNAVTVISKPKGLSALLDARIMGKERIVLQLLQLGANPNLRGPEGRTPLVYMVEAYQTPSLKCIRLLLSHGANKSIEDNNGYRAIDYARMTHNEAVVAVLQGK